METKIFSYIDAAPSAVEALRSRVLAAFRRGYRVILDLDELPELDNPALRGLILVVRGARAAGGSLALFVTRPEHRQMLQLTALDRIVEVAAC